MSNEEEHTEEPDDSSENDEVELDINIVFVCGLKIDIEEISRVQILKLRKLMPKFEYR